MSNSSSHRKPDIRRGVPVYLGIVGGDRSKSFPFLDGKISRDLVLYARCDRVMTTKSSLARMKT